MNKHTKEHRRKKQREANYRYRDTLIKKNIYQHSLWCSDKCWNEIKKLVAFYKVIEKNLYE